MKNNEDFRASVFEKAAAYEAERKKKRQARLRRAAALVLCALVAVPLLYIPIKYTVGNISTAPSFTTTQGVGGPPLAGSATDVAKTEAFSTTNVLTTVGTTVTHSPASTVSTTVTGMSTTAQPQFTTARPSIGGEESYYTNKIVIKWNDTFKNPDRAALINSEWELLQFYPHEDFLEIKKMIYERFGSRELFEDNVLIAVYSEYYEGLEYFVDSYVIEDGTERIRVRIDTGGEQSSENRVSQLTLFVVPRERIAENVKIELFVQTIN